MPELAKVPFGTLTQVKEKLQSNPIRDFRALGPVDAHAESEKRREKVKRENKNR
jgi:hypothetical protein